MIDTGHLKLAVGSRAARGASPDGEGLLDIVDLKTHFVTPRGIARAVDGVSLRVRRGTTLGIVGESGSGKSVLSRTIMGILARDGSVRHSGRIMFQGRDLRTLAEREMRAVRGRDIAMIFQDPMSSLNPVMKIGNQITEVLRAHLGMSSAAARGRAAELLDLVGLPDPQRQLDRYPVHLSGGMRQRVAIAVALAAEPRLLIADEPTTALDVTVQSQILELLRSLQRQRDMSVILITHNLGIVSGYTDDLIVMYAGRIVETAPTRDLLSRPLMPYTEALMQSSPVLTAPPHTRLTAIPGLPPSLIDPTAGCRFGPRCRYATDTCRERAPALLPDAAGGHLYACHHPLPVPETSA